MIWKRNVHRQARQCLNLDDGLIGAETVDEARDLQGQIQDLFSKEGFSVREWKACEEAALDNAPSESRDKIIRRSWKMVDSPKF